MSLENDRQIASAWSIAGALTGIKPQRLEKITIKLRLAGPNVVKHEADIRLLTGLDVKDGDSVNIDYDFLVAYWGDIVERMSAVERIVSDPSVVVEASSECLHEAKCLIQQLFLKLEDVRLRCDENNLL